jgi:hypothetical protein
LKVSPSIRADVPPIPIEHGDFEVNIRLILDVGEMHPQESRRRLFESGRPRKWDFGARGRSREGPIDLLRGPLGQRLFRPRGGSHPHGEQQQSA